MNTRLLERVADTLMYVCMGLGTLLLISVAATGCSTLENLASTKIPVNSIIVAANGVDGLISTATNYISYCSPNPAPAGCSDDAVQKLIPAVRSALDARNNAEAFIAAHPGQLGSQGLLDAITTATGTIQQIISEFNVKTP